MYEYYIVIESYFSKRIREIENLSLTESSILQIRELENVIFEKTSFFSIEEV